MAYMLRKIGNATNVAINIYEVDNESDMNALDTSKIPMGSVCYIINDDTKYKLNSAKVWKEMA